MRLERFMHVVIPPHAVRASEIIAVYRAALGAAFEGVGWEQVDAVPNAPAPGTLYVLRTDRDETESAEAFHARHGSIPADVAARTFLESPSRGQVIHRVAEPGFAGAFGVDFGLIGRTDLFHEVIHDREPSLWSRGGVPINPDYCRYPGGEATIAAYVRALLEVFD